MIRRLAVWLLVSVGIHAALIGLTLVLVAVTPAPMLFVDLVHGVLATIEPAPGGDIGRGDGTPVHGARAPAPPRPVRPERSKPAPTTAASTARTARAPAETMASTPVVEPDPVASPEPIRPLPEAIPPPVGPPRASPEPAPAVTEPPRPLVELSTLAASAPVRVAENTPPASPASGAAAEAPAGGGETSATPALADGGEGTRPGSSGPASGPVTARGSGTASGASSGGRGAVTDGAGLGVGAREGSTLALAVPGERGGEGSEYAGYYALLRRRVQEALTYPATARRRELTGTVQVEIDIQSTGAITQVVLAVSSSHRVLDDAALEAVRGIERLPFPPDLRPRRLRVRLPVVFALR